MLEMFDTQFFKCQVKLRVGEWGTEQRHLLTQEEGGSDIGQKCVTYYFNGP
jgi:hypothetical protein